MLHIVHDISTYMDNDLSYRKSELHRSSLQGISPLHFDPIKEPSHRDLREKRAAEEWCRTPM
jgi:hypothetical protein